jgi:hypothetical protein
LLVAYGDSIRLWNGDARWGGATQEQPLSWGKQENGWPCLDVGSGWCKTSETLDAVDPVAGPPVWADDGSEGLGVVLTYERQVQFPPLQGWWSKRNFSFRIFRQNPGKAGQAFVVDAPLAGQVTSLHWMKRAGYILVGRYLENDGLFVAIQNGGTQILIPNGIRTVPVR